MSLELLLDAAKYLEQQEESCKGKGGGGGVGISGGGRYLTGQHRLCCKCGVCLQISKLSLSLILLTWEYEKGFE